MMRKNSLFILLLVALLSLPAFAFADSSTDELSGGKGVGWQGIITSGDDAGLYGAAGRARNKYNMACWVMGKNPLTIADEVRSKLSDPNRGGRFYEYANTFESIPSWEYVPEWQPTYANLTYVLYGFDFQWESAVPQSLYEGAKEDFRRVLAGEDLGGGGSGVPSAFPAGDYYRVDVVANGNAAIPSKYSFREIYFQVDAYNRLMSQLSTDYRLWFSCFHISNSNRDTTGIFASSNAYISSGHIAWANNANVKGLSSVLLTDDSGVGRQVVYWSDNPSTANDFPVSQNNCSPVYFLIPLDPENDPVVTLPFGGGDWPEPEPTPTPTPPEIPTPTAPTVTPDPTPTAPTPTWPVIPTPTAPTVVTVVTPEGLDYTQLLTLINDNLNDINSYTVAINSSLNSLRSDLVTEFEGVTQGLRNIYQYLQHLDDLLERHCKHLRDALDDGIYNLELYIKSLFEWLPQQLEFDAKFDYDDTAVTSLLRRILFKIPGGSGDAPTSYMPNPQSDEPGFFDWLLDLWHRFLIDLVSVLPDELGGLVDTLSQLTHYFPFSIPWDLFALLSLFAHEPVTPVFDVPLPYTSEDSATVHVDLSVWDPVAAMMRPCFLVIFCLKLALLTRDLLSGFDLSKGGV